MTEVRTNYFDSHNEEDRNRISDACLVIVGQTVYNRDPDPRDVSVLPQFFTRRVGGRSAYYVEITVELDSVDWPPGLHGPSEVRQTYDRMAESILTRLAPSIPKGREFCVWVRGRVDGFAEGLGTHKL